MKQNIVYGKFAAALALTVAGFTAAFAADALPKYKQVEGVSGNLNSIGSDTLNNLMTFWAEAFRKHYPSVNIQIEGKGSATAPPALIEGTAQLGPMSRLMKAEESDKYEEKYGFKPTAVGVALDSLAVYVHKDNPIKSLSLPQVDAIFSKTRTGGHSADIATWGQVGLTGAWANLPMSLYGRNSASGTYAFFKEHALYKGDYKDTVKEQPGSASVVMGITEDKNAVGYSGIGYKTSGVRVVPLAKEEGGEAFTPDLEHVLSGKYPLGRMLYIYIGKAPNKPLDPVIAEFLKMVLSDEGQAIVEKDGYLPLPGAIMEKQVALLK
ncbi:MAG: PstS family phosphate ABC transporter substrate-binding protein [Candidatus Hydrogenedentota bacterium]